MNATPDAKQASTGNLEAMIGRVLQLGVVISLTLILTGTLITFMSERDRPDAASLALFMERKDPPVGQPGGDPPVLHAPAPDAPGTGDAPQPMPPPVKFHHNLGQVFRDALTLRGPALVMLGLLVLLATPVTRVVASIILFHRQRDTLYVVLTSIVLLLLGVSFLLGKVA